MDLIEIEVSRYEELLKYEFVYNLYRDKLMQDSYVNELDRTLFEIPKKVENSAEDDF